VQVLEHYANGRLQHFGSLFAIAFAGLLRLMCVVPTDMDGGNAQTPAIRDGSANGPNRP
jgi:hypothetical protein